MQCKIIYVGFVGNESNWLNVIITRTNTKYFVCHIRSSAELDQSNWLYQKKFGNMYWIFIGV